jgi:PAS domain S-box-containing protein
MIGTAVHEVPLLAAIILFGALAAHQLRNAGPLPHWVAGWTAAGIAGFLPFVESALPRLQPIAHPLGTLYAALLLSGTLLLADRAIPRWLFPAALGFGIARAIVAERFGAPAGYALGLACEPLAVLAAAWVAFEAAPRSGAKRAELLLGPSLLLLGLAGAAHLAWLASGRPLAPLAPLWLVVVPIALGAQVHAAGGKLRRSVQRRLEQRVAERTLELAESEERWRAISELSTDFAFKVRIDAQLQLTREWVTGGLAKALGMDPSQLDGTGWLHLIGPASRGEVDRDIEALQGHEKRGWERQLLRADGSPCWLQLRLETLQVGDDGSLLVLGAGRDITERKQTEAERERLARHLEQVQRLESLGILVGGIAHDFNNLLTVIRGSARLVLDDLAPGAAARPRIERIAAAAEHAAELTEEMLAYAGKAPTALAPLDVSALVIMNLVLNAADALGGEGGRVVLSTRLVDVARSDLDGAFGAADVAPGRFVAIEVRDTGCGMDEATAARVFEPFFSTKFSGRGLGMAAVLGIVQSHRGVIRIDSAPGRGTTVRVLLPPTVHEGAALRAVAARSATAGGNVLVVDDDAEIVDLVREVLERAGLGVVAAPGGCAAIETLRATTDIDAAVIDLAMPDMSGEELFVRLREQRPDLPVILVTGYDAAHAAQRFGARGLHAFLRKPWEPEDLVAAVRNAIAAARTPTPGAG